MWVWESDVISIQKIISNNLLLCMHFRQPCLKRGLKNK